MINVTCERIRTLRDSVNVVCFLLEAVVIDVFVEFRRIPEPHYICLMHAMQVFDFMNTPTTTAA